MRLFVAGLRKFARRPVTFVTFGLLIGLLALIYIAVGATARQQPTQQGSQAALLLVTFPAAYALLLSFILGLGGLFAMIYGAAIAGSEWTWGTLKAAIARGESRSRYQLLSFASIAVIVGVGLVVAFVVGLVVTVIAASLAGVGTAGIGDSDDDPDDPRAARPRLARDRRGDRARLHDRDAGPQPAGRHRGRHRRLLRRAVRLDLPARHRQVRPVQRRQRGRRDRHRAGQRRGRPARTEHGPDRRPGLARRRSRRHRSLHRARRDHRLSPARRRDALTRITDEFSSTADPVNTPQGYTRA